MAKPLLKQETHTPNKMFSRNVYKGILFWLLMPFVYTTSTAQVNEDEPCRQTGILLGMLSKYHYQPVELNAGTSTQIFNDFIKAVDPYSNILIEPELASLSEHKEHLLDINAGETICEFLNAMSSAYYKGVKRKDSLSGSILSKPFDFTVKDSIVFLPKYEPMFVPNVRALEIKLIRRLKYHTLNMLFTPVADEDPLKLPAKELLLKEAEARKKLIIREKRATQPFLEDPSVCKRYIAEMFHSTIASRFDPHTNFFSPSEKENFETHLSKEAKAFGLSFDEGKNGEVEIAHLSPGGPAWKSNQLHKGDVVLHVKWPKGQLVDLANSTYWEVDQMINYSGYDNMVLTVRKANGVLHEVPLIKEMINVDENVISGYMLEGEKKIGYISLPGFYTEWDTENALGCANDVAKEILKLQKENIEGLILDLRYNGGGSLYEAMGLLGIFIDEGPLFMIRGRNEKPALMKDMNRGTAYTGPLILMVNSLSASASELVAAGLKDYNRALIVGSNTYGKAIGQITLPLDTTVDIAKRAVQKKKISAFVNITVNKLYRVNGVSHQKTGIEPDIILPDLYTNDFYGEAAQPYAINSDFVDKKVFYNPLTPLPVFQVREHSIKRVSAEAKFANISSTADSLKKAMSENEVLLLNIETFRDHKTRLKATEQKLDDLFTADKHSYKVRSTRYDDAVIRSDEIKKEMNADIMKKISDDIYIEEVYLIMNDLINSTTK